jgi:VWFA-related protein
MSSRPRFALAAAALCMCASLAAQAQDGFRFKSGVDLVNVTATVTDDTGRFVAGLRRDDFEIYDEDVPQAITHFSSERVPVSLGILLDTSGSMTIEKMAAARSAIRRFIYELLGREDELFFVEFADEAYVRQTWTTDRNAVMQAVTRAAPGGGTALYDAVAQSLPIAASGKHRKKALLVISDGNDADSRTTAAELRQAIRESEVLVYALGVDAQSANRQTSRPPRRPTPPIFTPPPTTPPPVPRPIPGGRRRPPVFPQIVIGGGSRQNSGADERVDAAALRAITDDTGGRTEIVREARDLNGATARLADELSRQYTLAFVAAERDGRWHSIRVEVKGRRGLTVRARSGYTAS